MLEGIPKWVEILFLVTCLITIGLFYYSNGKPRKIMFVIILWSIAQSILAYNGFYQNTNSTPPRFGLVLVPATLLIIFGLTNKRKTWFLKERNINISTFLHFVRLPVEIVLFELFMFKMIPELMTFEGRNFDILMGITAPIVGYLFIKNKIGKKILLIWNIIGLVLVIFILINGVLSTELSFQQFGFEQPNRAVNYFPFVLLPATIVPLVIWTHISDIIKLREEIKNT